MKRAAITGMGVVSPLGNSVDEFASGLLAGRSGIGPIQAFDASALPTRIAGECSLRAPPPFGDTKIGFALQAAGEAMRQAFAEESPTGRGGLSLGVGLELFSMADLAKTKQPSFQSPASSGTATERLSFLQTPSDLCVHLLAHRYQIRTPPATHISACAAGTDAIGRALSWIRRGTRDWVLCGGTDSMLNPLGVAGFCSLNATSERNAEPQRASRPFDLTRDGFVMGEGAGVLVLEEWEHARERGATILGEVSGFGCSLDAFKISDPAPDGRGAAAAIRAALLDAQLPPEGIDAINAHGTGTPKNDIAETRALKAVFGKRAHQIPVSATKSMIGHLISAAGGVEAVAAVECMRRGQLHPTINLHHPDPECDLDYVPHEARALPQRHVLSTSYGFGGKNACLVLSAAEAR